MFYICIETSVNECDTIDNINSITTTSIKATAGPPNRHNNKGYLIPFNQTKTHLQTLDDADWSMINATNAHKNDNENDCINSKSHDELFNNNKQNQKNKGKMFTYFLYVII